MTSTVTTTDAPAPMPSPAWVGTALAAAVLALGAAPSVTDRDAGELTTAAFMLDVPHPTGFPLDMVALRLAELFPCGDVGFRANLAVAVLTALACGLATHLGWKLCTGLPTLARWPAALLPTVALLCSSTVLRAGTAAEVYASVMFASAAALCLALPPTAHASLSTRRRAAALLAGCGLALHTSARPAALLSFVVLCFPLRGEELRALGRRALACASLGITGVATLAYLPMSARRRGPIDWGDPSTLHGFVRHVTAASIREAYGTRMLAPWRWSEDFARVSTNLVQDLGMPLLFAGGIGAVFARWDRAPRILVVLAAADVFFAVAIHPMGTTDRQTLFVAELCLALLALHAIAKLAATGTPRAPWLAGGLAAALCVSAVGRCDPTWAGAADGWSESEILGGAGALGEVPLRAVVLCASDDLCGGGLYAQWVEGERPDVTMVPRQWLDDPSTWRRVTARRLGMAIPSPLGEGNLRQRRLRGLLTALGPRIRWENPERDDARWLGVETGSGETPVLPTVSGSVTSVDTDAVRWVRDRLPTKELSREGAGARWVGALVVFGAAWRVARAGVIRAVPLWRWTVSLEPGHAPSYTDLGVAAARARNYAQAIALTRRAIALDPERATAWRNLGDYLEATGDASGAERSRAEARRRTE